MREELMREELMRAWGELCPYEELGLKLLDRWSEPHRHYHGLAHLAAVLAAVDQLAEPQHDLRLVRLAAWYHDAVYDLPPGPISNEEASAQLAEAELGEPEVARLVRITTDHRATVPNAELLCDADLAVLAGTPDEYAAYTAGIRREYGFVPDEKFRAGRAAILRSLLAQPLFRTVRGRALEAAARRNVSAEIAELVGTAS